MLWKIEDSQTYLLGSLHLTNMRHFKLRELAEAAFNQAETIFFEADFGVPPDPLLRHLPEGQHLSSLISPPLFKRASSVWARLGKPAGDLERLMPFFAGMDLGLGLASQAGYLSKFGVETHVLTRAKANGKRIEVLEKVNAGFEAIASGPLSEHIQAFERILAAHDFELHRFAKMVKAWARDEDWWFEKYLRELLQTEPVIWSGLIDQRNLDWLPKILAVAQAPRPCLIVVGALHMFGPSGIPELLKRQGLVSVRMPKGFKP